MEVIDEKLKILKAIRNAIAILILEEDSTFDYDNLTDEEVEELYKKLVIKRGKI